MKILATADIHFSREHQVEALASLTVLAETAEREKPALVAISGDLFDRGVQNSTAGGFPALLAVIQRILDVCPIAAVYGTPTHDLPGCYDALEALKARYPFIRLDPTTMLPPVAWVCENGRIEVEIDSDGSPVSGENGPARLMILGVPEPSREWLLAANEGQSSQETAEAMKTALRGILLGLGAIRAQHPGIPCCMLYHGPVEGASMQNGQVIGAGSITIGREDLALVGADYYALGDIHLAQQIPGLPAYYPGSAYPVSWGELGTSGFNLVEIAENNAGPDSGWDGPRFAASITRVNYPHPRRVKFSLPWPEPAGPEVEGVQAWICYRATKEEAAKIDIASYLNSYLLAGALPGSRVTVETTYTETIRASEIIEKHTLREKVLVKAKADSEPAPMESVLLKADLLEREAEGQGIAGVTHHLRLRKSRVRGHVSHHKRLGVEEITLDLSKYGPGLIAMIGPNGIGKTSLAENCHMLPCEFSEGRDRKGGLKDNFVLRDSAREVWEDDPRTGEQWRSLMEIDGANATGKVECHLFYKAPGAEQEVPVAGGKGRMANYVDEITKLIGSKRMFLRSAFWTQESSDNNPRIRRAKEGEKKAIFAELALSAPYKEYSVSAGGKAKVIETQITTGRGQVTLLERITVEEPDVEAAIRDGQDLVIFADSKIAMQVEKGKNLKHQVEQLAGAVAEQDALGRDIGTAANEAQKKFGQVEEAKEKISDFTAALGSRAVARDDIAAYDKLKAEEAAENERLSGINKERARLSAEYSDALKAHQADVRGLEVQRTRIRMEKARLEGDHKVLLSQCDHLQKEIEKPITDECPLCGAEKEHQHKDLNAGREEKQGQFRDISEKIHALGNQIMGKEGELLVIVGPAAPVAPQLPAADDTELQGVRQALGQIDITSARETLEIAAKAEQAIATLTAQIAALEADSRSLNEKAEQLRAKLNPQIATDHAEALKLYEAARTAYTIAKEERATAQAKLEAAQQQLAVIQKQKCELEELRTSLGKMETQVAEWRYLEAVTGPDGIPALELDALGPGISAEANKLLMVLKDYEIDNHYDQIKFETTRLAGKGSKTHQIEDFTIYCHDVQHDDWVDFALISVGEAVWVDTALMDAFAIIRDRNSGKRSLTQWRDESDAALDPQSRQAYFALLQAAHDASGRYQTIITTHSPEAQEMIAQKIDLVQLAMQAQQSAR